MSLIFEYRSSVLGYLILHVCFLRFPRFIVWNSPEELVRILGSFAQSDKYGVAIDTHPWSNANISFPRRLEARITGGLGR